MNQNDAVGYASGDKIAAFISYLSTILATLLLVGAILVLYKINNNDLRLGMIALFTIIFAGSVGLLTNGSMAEVFGATAALVIPYTMQIAILHPSSRWAEIITYNSYAAVLVVFVSGDFTNG